MATAERVGLLGVGSMGAPIGARLLAGGVRLSVFDRRPDAIAPLVKRGAEPADSLAELGRRSTILVTLLPNGKAVTEAVESLVGVLPAGALAVDMGSSTPNGTRALGATLAQHGVAMVDAPVSGGVARAETGQLSVMVGGDAAAIERCRPLLALVASQVFVVGPLGAGHALKALNNLVSAAGLLAAAEALLVGQRFGIDPGLMVDVFNASTARNNATENKLRQFVLSRSFASGFSLRLMVKDLATALELADDTGTPAHFAAACRDLWTAAAGELDADADHTAIVRWLERLAGPEKR